MKWSLVTTSLSLFLSLACARGPEKSSIPLVKIQPFGLGDVRLLPGPFHDAGERNRAYLHQADIDRLLHMFRVNAGLPSSAEPLGEWESPEIEIRGHTLGHYLTACALSYAGSGDEELERRAEQVVAELARCQAAIGNGYLSAFPEEFFDRLESGKTVWAPWYTIHKIMSGLLAVHVMCGNDQALAVLTGMAGWVKNRTDRLTTSEMQESLEAEFGGMNAILYDLYALTREPQHLELARRFNHQKFLDPLTDNQDRLKGLHANTAIPKVIGFAREFETAGSRDYRDASEYFWRQVVRSRSFATGGTSNYEHWRSDPFELANELSVAAHESCCSYNMLELTRHLFTWTGDSQYADFCEKALFNAVLPTQNPADGSLMYFVPMVSGMWKMFMKPWHSFLCCNGTGIESFAKLQDSIYFHDDEGIYLNLFIASELEWAGRGIRVRQETRFPEEARTSLKIRSENPVELSFYIRIPHWARDGVAVRVNGEQAADIIEPGSYFTLRRTWTDGDQITVDLPMGLSLERLPGEPERAAILYGPLVLAGELGTESMTEAMIAGFKEPETNLMWLRQVKSLFHGPAVEPPVLITADEDPNVWIRSISGESLTFQTTGVGRPLDVRLVPFYKLFGQRYAIYWEILNEDEWRARQSALKLPDGVVDEVRFGDSLSERMHNFQAFQFARGADGANDWVQSSFWLQADLRVHPDQQTKLRCMYSADENADFDVLIDTAPLASESFRDKPMGETVEAEYPIPREMTREKTRISVMLEAHTGRSTGRLVSCSIY